MEVQALFKVADFSPNRTFFFPVLGVGKIPSRILRVALVCRCLVPGEAEGIDIYSKECGTISAKPLPADDATFNELMQMVNDGLGTAMTLLSQPRQTSLRDHAINAGPVS